MNVSADTKSPFAKDHQIVAYIVAEGEDGKAKGVLAEADAATGGGVGRAIKEKDFTGAARQTVLLYTTGGSRAARVLLAGAGAPKALDGDSVRRATGAIVRRARELKARRLAIAVSPKVIAALGDAETAASVVAETVELASYVFEDLKTPANNGKGPAYPGVEKLTLHLCDRADPKKVRAAIGEAQILGEAANLTRRVGNQPGNICTPTYFGQQAKKLARQVGLTCKVIEKKEAEKLGMGGLLGVSRGSDEPPTFTILDHKPRGARETICIVGKGVTFDSGGISIKPADLMWDMKFDKMGACAVLGIMSAVARLALPIRVIGLMPACENLPSGRATKPGDVITAITGKTIEVQNTDAEGRLILADALGYAKRYDPDAVIDMATLTGAIVVALGSFNAGLYSTDDSLRDGIVAAGRRTGERAWPMPLDDEYAELLKSDVADVKNIGGRAGGSITAARFLHHFTDYPWAHIDIAGTAWNTGGPDNGYLSKGATGFGVRLVTDYLRARAAAGGKGKAKVKKGRKKKARA